VDDEVFLKEWAAVKATAKERAAAKILELTGVQVNTSAMFDIQVKRIHEYKRQLMNLMSIIARYDAIKKMTPEQRKSVVPRVCVIGGKAAPGASTVWYKLLHTLYHALAQLSASA
jgi:glycogen phosphorylase